LPASGGPTQQPKFSAGADVVVLALGTESSPRRRRRGRTGGVFRVLFPAGRVLHVSTLSLPQAAARYTTVHPRTCPPGTTRADPLALRGIKVRSGLAPPRSASRTQARSPRPFSTGGACSAHFVFLSSRRRPAAEAACSINPEPGGPARHAARPCVFLPLSLACLLARLCVTRRSSSPDSRLLRSWLRRPGRSARSFG